MSARRRLIGLPDDVRTADVVGLPDDVRTADVDS